MQDEFDLSNIYIHVELKCCESSTDCVDQYHL